MIVTGRPVNIIPMIPGSDQSQIAFEMIEAAPNVDINTLYTEQNTSG
jgi:hypothetical protein